MHDIQKAKDIAKSVAFKGAIELAKDNFDFNGDLSAQSEKVLTLTGKFFDYLISGSEMAIPAVFEIEDSETGTKTAAEAKQGLKCPKCGSDIWDNRDKIKEGFPILKCKNTGEDCLGEGAKWPWSIFDKKDVDSFINQVEKAAQETGAEPPF